MLHTQYRMHPEIQRYPSAKYYDDTLVADRSVLSRARGTIPLGLPPYTFVDVGDGKEQCVGKTYSNKREVAVVASLVRGLLKAGAQPSDIGVITFYNGQLAMLKTELDREQKPPGIEVKTVDGFQVRVPLLRLLLLLLPLLLP
jgi:superfamily I DNA and/or RNA helicase